MPYPPERIWRALTEGELIEQWLMKNDFQPVVGHKFNFRAQPMGGWNGVADCEVLVADPPRSLAWSQNASGEQAADGLKSIVTWTLTLPDAGTLLRMEHAGFPREGRRRLPGDELRLATCPGKPGACGRGGETVTDTPRTPCGRKRYSHTRQRNCGER